MNTNGTNMEEETIIYKDLSYKIVGLAMEVHNELGPGFLEKGHIIGDYFADILVEDSIIIELKAQDRIAEIHKAQTLNYLKATQYKLALLINFGKHRLEYERLVL